VSKTLSVENPPFSLIVPLYGRLARFSSGADIRLNDFLSQAPLNLVQMNRHNDAGIERILGIRITAIGPDFICGEMPVDERTRQPFGILHGGASIVLAETLGSWASWLLAADQPGARVAGIEVSGSHLRAVRSGLVTAVARPLRLGRSLHFWEIDVRDEAGNLTCSARLTVNISAGRN
jgi:1,4-dihydroxy-2-naphthoyl-CoA hydrolase